MPRRRFIATVAQSDPTLLSTDAELGEKSDMPDSCSMKFPGLPREAEALETSRDGSIPASFCKSQASVLVGFTPYKPSSKANVVGSSAFSRRKSLGGNEVG